MLRARGYDVYAPTLTGLADRSHLLDKAIINLDTHIDDITGLLFYEDLWDVILVGHSYAGLVVAGVAARVPQRIRHLVFLDAIVPHDNETHLDTCDPEQAALLRRIISEEGGGTRVPALSTGLGYFGITKPEHRAWVGPRLTDQPAATYQQSVGSVAAAMDLPRTFYRCCRSDLVSRKVLSRVRRDPHMHYVELDAGHDVMITDPGLLTEQLTLLAESSSSGAEEP
jgi:pimeloyl-ACP methyl ester carboxylesterase